MSGIYLEEVGGKGHEGFLEEVMLSLRLVRKMERSLLGYGGDGEAPGGKNSIGKGAEAEKLSRRG